MNKQEPNATKTTRKATAGQSRRDSRDKKNPKETDFLSGINFPTYEEILESYPPTDHDFGRLFADVFHARLRYVYNLKIWRYFNGVKWEDDTSGIFAERCAGILVEHLKKRAEEDVADYIIQLSKRPKKRNMILEAQSIRPVLSTEFDSNIHLFNCLNCTIDLRDGSEHKHNPDDLITKVANVTYDPKVVSERWNRFVDEIMSGDAEMVDYLQKSLGYALSGDTSLDCFFIFFGKTTRNGKSACIGAVRNVLGDYGKGVSPASLSKKNMSGDNPTPEFARLTGVRFANVSEPGKFMKLNAGFAKTLTGRDPIITRYLHKNPIEFIPQFTIYIVTNHLIDINDDSIFASDRIKMVPFDKHFKEAEQDKSLRETLENDENATGVLNWLLEGHKRYLAEGTIVPPQRAIDALTEYRRECDTTALFLEDTCVKTGDVTQRLKTSVLYDHYITWFTENCDIMSKPMSRPEFVSALKDKVRVERHRTDSYIIKGFVLKEKKVEASAEPTQK